MRPLHKLENCLKIIARELSMQGRNIHVLAYLGDVVVVAPLELAIDVQNNTAAG